MCDGNEERPTDSPVRTRALRLARGQSSVAGSGPAGWPPCQCVWLLRASFLMGKIGSFTSLLGVIVRIRHTIHDKPCTKGLGAWPTQLHESHQATQKWNL